jgi:hypothetical protein
MEKNRSKLESESMITKEELREYAKTVALNLGQAEKDYFQNILLFILFQAYGRDLVFKGGTALKKCFGLRRFSEDLDFSCLNKIDVKKLGTGLNRFKVEYEMESRDYENELKITLRIKGPLYMGVRQSLCKLVLDFSFRENVILKPEIKTLGRFLEEVPSFDVFVMQEKEILAEKIRAILTRTKARDVYDVWFLIDKGVGFNRELVKKKLKYYNQKWNPAEFRKHLNMKKNVWEIELKPLVPALPKFNDAKRLILKAVK